MKKIFNNFYKFLIFNLLIFLLISCTQTINYNDESEYFKNENGVIYYKGSVFSGYLVERSENEVVYQKSKYDEGKLSNLEFDWYREDSDFIIHGTRIELKEEDSNFTSEIDSTGLSPEPIVKYKNSPFTGQLYQKFDNGNIKSKMYLDNGRVMGEQLDFFENGKVKRHVFLSESLHRADSLFEYSDDEKLKVFTVNKTLNAQEYETYSIQYFLSGDWKSKRRTLISKNKSEDLEFELRTDFPSFLIDKSFVENCDSWRDDQVVVEFHDGYSGNKRVINVSGDHWGGPVTDVILNITNKTILIEYDKYFEGERVGNDNLSLKYSDNGKILLVNSDGVILDRYKICFKTDPDSSNGYFYTGSEFYIDLNEDDFSPRYYFDYIR